MPACRSAKGRAIAITGAVLALPVTAVAAWQVVSGDDGSDPPPTPTTVERAQTVRACERLHGMTRASDRRRARAERHGRAFDATAYRWRSGAWPPPVGAEPDGSSEYVQEQVYDPAIIEAENPIDDVWYGNCERFEVRLLAVKTGAAIPFTVRVAVGDDLAPDEAVVRHSSREVVRGVRCLG